MILFNLCGHGHFDMQAYADYFAGLPIPAEFEDLVSAAILPPAAALLRGHATPARTGSGEARSRQGRVTSLQARPGLRSTKRWLTSPSQLFVVTIALAGLLAAIDLWAALRLRRFEPSLSDPKPRRLRPSAEGPEFRAWLRAGVAGAAGAPREDPEDPGTVPILISC